tara:strand:- start:291 stop:1190 length:900 start_codon:yes stop_codon:yes gene_type:complete
VKPNDQLDDPRQLAHIRDIAMRAIQDADAFGVFPTPVDEIIEAAKHSVVANQDIDDHFLAKRSKRTGGVLKKALSKVLGVLDVAARTMHLDKTVHAAKLPFLKLHELGHGILPWQRDIYALTADCKQTLDPDINDLFERETNAFASEVLFQVDTFTNEAADYKFSINTPITLSKTYGASVYATVRRYVRTNARSCVVLVLNPPVFVEGHGFKATLRRVVASPTFESQFIGLQWPKVYTPDDALGKIVPFDRRMSRPQSIELVDANGTRHECVAEAFNSTHQIFILICPQAALAKKIILT